MRQGLRRGGQGAAIDHGLEMLRRRKQGQRHLLLPPWVFLITDGAPTESVAAAEQAIKAGEAAKAFPFFAVGVEGANMDILAKLSTRQP